MVKTTQEHIDGAAARFAADNANDDTIAAVFKWSNPAPRIDGTTPNPWRVADAEAGAALVQSLGFDDGYAVHFPKWRGRPQLYVGLRGGVARRPRLRDALKAAGYRVRWSDGQLFLVDSVAAVLP